MLTAQDTATIVRSLYDALNRRDMDKSLALVTEDVKWLNVPFNVHSVGRNGYREYLENWTKAMPDFKIEIVNLVPGDEWTAVEFIARGTHTGPFVGPQGTIPATQKKLDLKCCELLRIKDEKISEAHLYFDGATLMRQFDVVPNAPTARQPVPSGN